MAETPHTDTPQIDKIFEIGLVMAGAVSAGAYTAGVADFLIEALDQWYAFNKPKGSSPHEVKLRVISGASAGGMTGSILTAAFGGDFSPVRARPTGKSDNPLYRAWVQDIDIGHLLQSNDIEAIRRDGQVQKQRTIRKLRKLYFQKRISLEDYESKVQALDAKTLVSILDSTKLCEIADNAVNVTANTLVPMRERRPYLPERFELFLSIANLRGVSYRLDMQGGGSRMVTHADYMHFALTEEEPETESLDHDGNRYISWVDTGDGERHVSRAFWLDPARYGARTWKTLSDASLATGAFPFGLAPVKLKRMWEEYKDRTFPISKFENGVYSRSFQPLHPERNKLLEETNTYEFISVDGGLLDNAPFDLAHRALTEKLGVGNERNPGLSDRAMILVAPFPDSMEPETYREPSGLMGLAGAVLNSLITQVRFNPEELILASDPNIGSRFLISPERSPGPPDLKHGEIACGTLSGFGGFLSEEFRHHDFMLGRRNCQRFLQHWFTLPEDNPLFSNWDADLKTQFYLEAPENAKSDGKYLPIIPLVGTADPRNHEVALHPWPTYSTAQLDTLMIQIESRLTKVSNFFIDVHAGGLRTRLLLRLGLWTWKKKVLRSMRSTIRDSLAEYGIPWTGPEDKPANTRSWLILILAAVGIGAVLALAMISYVLSLQAQ